MAQCSPPADEKNKSSLRKMTSEKFQSEDANQEENALNF